jgi:hypothetical protein
MDPIIYVAMALNAIFVTAFVLNIVVFAGQVIIAAYKERTYKTFTNSGNRRRKAFNKPSEITKKVNEKVLQKAEKLYIV